MAKVNFTHVCWFDEFVDHIKGLGWEMTPSQHLDPDGPARAVAKKDSKEVPVFWDLLEEWSGDSWSFGIGASTYALPEVVMTSWEKTYREDFQKWIRTSLEA